MEKYRVSALERVPNLLRNAHEDYLVCEIAVLPGGVDFSGRPLVVFPSANLSKLQGAVLDALPRLLQYYIDITPARWKTNGFGIAVNLKQCKDLELIQGFIEALEKVEAANQGSIGALYVIQPKSKDTQRFLKKKLGLKLSKKHPKSPVFKSYPLSSQDDLYNFLELSQLPQEYGGSWPYVHASWVEFRKVIDQLYEDIEEVYGKLPDAFDKIHLLQEYDPPMSSEEMQQLLSDMSDRYHEVMRELNIEPLIDECNECLEKLTHPELQPVYQDVCHMTMYTDSSTTIHRHRQQLMESRKSLKSIWQQAEGKVIQAAELGQYQLQAEKVYRWLERVGFPSLQQQQPHIADSLKQAELVKEHFESGFYSAAKKVLSEAEELISRAEQLVVSGEMDIRQALSFSRKFESLVVEFKGNLEKRYKLYRDIHQFYVLLAKVIDQLYEDIEEVYGKLPDAFDKIHLLQEYDPPMSSEEMQQLLSDMSDRYHEVMRELNIEPLIDECNECLEKLTHPELQPVYQDVCHMTMFTDSSTTIHRHRQQLMESRKSLKSTWQQAEGKVIQAAELGQYQLQAEKVYRWLERVGFPSLQQQQPHIADSLKQAELVKEHFESGFYSAAKKALSEAEELISRAERLVVSGEMDIRQALSFSRKFESLVVEFKGNLEKRYKLYRDIHQFYVLLAKVSRWYHKALQFIPVYLHRFPASHAVVSLTSTPDWDENVQYLLQYHPPPSALHLQDLKDTVPLVKSLKTRNKARLLAHRVNLLKNLLVGHGRVTPEDMRDILRWKEDILEGVDDISLGASSSEVSSLGQSQASLQADQSRPSSRQSSAYGSLTRAPKLRSRNCKSMYNIQIAKGSEEKPQQGNKWTHMPKSKSARTLPKQYAKKEGQKVESKHYNADKENSTDDGKPDILIKKKSRSKKRIDQSQPLKKHSTSSTTNGTAEAQGDDALPQRCKQERYVDLSYPVARPDLPATLRHVDPALIFDESPENVQIRAMKITRLPAEGKKQNGSIADSGIGHYRSGTEISGPAESSKTMDSRMRRPRDKSKDKSKKDRQRKAKSMYDLSSANTLSPRSSMSSKMGLTYDNLESIAQSDLPPEEKLNLMAALFEAEENHAAVGTQLPVELQNDSLALFEPKVESGKRFKNQKKSKSLTKLSRAQLKELEEIQKKQAAEELAQNEFVKEAMARNMGILAESDQSLLSYGPDSDPSISQVSQSVSQLENKAVPKVADNSQSDVGTQNDSILTDEHGIWIEREADYDYGIDIHKWMDETLGHLAASDQDEGTAGTEGQKPSKPSSVQKAQSECDPNTQHAEVTEKEEDSSSDTGFQEELQQKVAESLKRAEQLLQEEEAVLLQEKHIDEIIHSDDYGGSGPNIPKIGGNGDMPTAQDETSNHKEDMVKTPGDVKLDR
ncbi:uncharacterized protein LOC106158513 [Lingula anatina]|uniref:Uncharacterized protein LOC106158513 n=1 Tax=Lingula anatina TaxID=7574 RepID=A0A1S3HVC5_LINAN|nr:uncharacterized protein LOC106158513 [Lingula anatina]|eukprot:XP_013389992.1 uncharacterized protein LOC106158513 [Lingula anatina]